MFGRLRTRVRQLGLGSFEAYLELVTSGRQPDERQMVVDLLTTNETYFFREPRHFDLLAGEILSGRPRGRAFRVWSAASSSGEEAYSMAMVLADKIGLGVQQAWEVVGSDISKRVLERARGGHYPMQRIEGIPRAYLQEYCLKGTGPQEGTMLIDAPIRGRVSFRQVNLNETLPPDLGLFDVIFLRNMLIYFQNDTKTEIVRRVLGALQPNGWLVVGHSESLKGFHPRLMQHSPSVYRLLPR